MEYYGMLSEHCGRCGARWSSNHKCDDHGSLRRSSAELTHIHQNTVGGPYSTVMGSAESCTSPFCVKAAKTQDTAKPTNPKDAIGVTKPPLSTVPSTVTQEVGLALLEGALKYGRHNYRVIGVRASVYFDATLRHILSWWEGEDTDPDSGLSHITKAIASLYILRDAMIQDMLNDDRPPIAREGFAADLRARTKEILARYPDAVPAYTQKGESEKER